jgi:hypothetical protein
MAFPLDLLPVILNELRQFTQLVAADVTKFCVHPTGYPASTGLLPQRHLHLL